MMHVPLDARFQHLSPSEAIVLQKELAVRVQTTNGFDPATVQTVAGIDVSVKGGGRWVRGPEASAEQSTGKAAVVVLSYPHFSLLDRAAEARPITFPYVPGLLSFRESPLVLAAWEKLTVRPDLILVDGQGFAHPRRFGIACHLGVLLDVPAIGVAKSVLIGRYENLGDAPGDTAPLIHQDETIGMAVRSKARTNPLIVSVGHKIDLTTAVSFVLSCVRGYRLPEPTRQAHNFAGSSEQA
jgi:deoxyribonuclease V